MTSGFNKTAEELKKELDPDLYHIAREKGTERAFTGKYWDHHAKGTYNCAVCGAELFSSETKFNSGTGWPSFTDPVNLERVEFKDDLSHGITRTEVVCRRCGSHLGHVFDDLPRHWRSKAGGPQKTPDGKPASGKRYCINSISLNFKDKQV